MAKAFKCDLTGKLCEGEPKREVVVDLDSDTQIHVTVFKRQGKAGWAGPGELGPEAEGMIRKIVAVAGKK